MSATKRTPPKGDRPLIRSSHGTPQPLKAPKGAGGKPGKPSRGASNRTAKATSKERVKPASRILPPVPNRINDEAAASKDKEAKVKKAKAVPGATSTASDDAREIAVAVAVAALDKKASGLEVIDVAGRVDYADFLVLMSGRSDRHVTALASGIEEALRKKNKRALAVEGLPHANWVLMDFGDVVVHVFQDDARAAYDIDSLWMDARRVPVPIPPDGSPASLRPPT